MTAPARILLGAFGDPGHTFPMLALGAELRRRGHDVTLETWRRWRPEVEAGGMRFAAAPEYPGFPTRERPLKPYEAALRAARETERLVRELRPAVVVSDILTLGPALAGEMAGVPVATLVPHVHPAGGPGFPPYAFGARLPRTRVGRRLWTGLDPLVQRGLRQGRSELNETRSQLGLAPVERLHGGLSEALCLVASFPQLEYPRPWPAGTHVVGPLLWEPPAAEVELPPGDDPLVLVAPSTVQDPDHRLLRASLRGLAGLPVRVLATWNRRPLRDPVAVAPNTRLVEWVSYSRTMPRCDVVVCHGGHGTVARTLASGCRVVVSPAGGDMAENAARVDWAGVGTRLPRTLLSPRTLALAVRRALEDDGMGARVRELAVWASEHDAGKRASELVEGLVSAGAEARGVGLEPTTTRLTAEHSAD